MNPDAFFDRVHACLDARTDPLDDPAVVAFLDAHPEQLDAFARLRSDVRELGRAAAPPRPRWLPIAVVGALAAGALVAWLPRGTAPAPGRILEARFEELRPRSHLAATFAVREILFDSPTGRLETWQTRSVPR